MDEVRVLDPSVLDGLRKLTTPGEPDVLEDVLRMFLQEVPQRMDKLRIALAAGNIEEVHRAAHSLKGSAGNIGAQSLFAVCKTLDDVSKAGDLVAAADLVDAVGVEFGKVEAEIHRLMKTSG